VKRRGGEKGKIKETDDHELLTIGPVSGSKDMRNGRMKSAPAHCGFSQTASCSPPSGLKRRKACG